MWLILACVCVLCRVVYYMCVCVLLLLTFCGVFSRLGVGVLNYMYTFGPYSPTYQAYMYCVCMCVFNFVFTCMYSFLVYLVSHFHLQRSRPTLISVSHFHSYSDLYHSIVCFLPYETSSHLFFDNYLLCYLPLYSILLYHLPHYLTFSVCVSLLLTQLSLLLPQLYIMSLILARFIPMVLCLALIDIFICSL